MKTYNFESSIKINKVNPISDKFWDFSRLQYRKANPEEFIRYGLLESLVDFYKYPVLLIETEYWLPGNKFRADIIVWKDINNIDYKPFILVETKSNDVAIDDDIIDKTLLYSEQFEYKPEILVITNGTEHIIIRTSDNAFLKYLPSYDDAVSGNIEKIEPIEKYKKLNIPFDVFSLKTKKSVDRIFNNFGQIINAKKHVDFNTKKIFLEIFRLLLDEDNNYSNVSNNEYDIIQDYGVRMSSFGNSSGGRFYGFFRHFLLKTPYNNRNFCLTISTNTTNINGGKVNLSIIGGIDGKQSLQITSIGKSIFKENSFKLIHKGNISLGEGGAIKKNDLLEFLQLEYSDLICESEIFIGDYNMDKFDKNVFKNVILRLGILTDILDRFRTIIRNKKLRLT